MKPKAIRDQTIRRAIFILQTQVSPRMSAYFYPMKYDRKKKSIELYMVIIACLFRAFSIAVL